MTTDTIFSGDDIYHVDCTGDAVRGDEVRFSQAQFGGSHRRPVFLGYRVVTGTVVRDSYGAAKQQHTFTLDLGEGKTLRIKGRNLYRNDCYRKPWADEGQRGAAADEKHERGAAARRDRFHRREEQWSL